jgi:AcrR family transcriptional regulator
VDGLEGLSIGNLATAIGMSKSGLYAHFGSKQELQLATLREAARIFTDEVIRPAAAAPPGVGQVWRLCERYLEYSRGRVFPGGCFFYEVIAEFDARPGPVHEAVLDTQRGWTAHVEDTLAVALAVGELSTETDVPQLAFELIALMETANSFSVMHDDLTIAYDRARTGIEARLRAAAVDVSLVPRGPRAA